MNWKKLSASVITGIIFLCGASFSSGAARIEAINHTQSGSLITLTGTANAIKPGELIGITILPNGKSPENAADNDVLFASQHKIKDDAFVFEINMGSETREVTAWLSSEYGVSTVSYDFTYKSTDDVLAALTVLNGASDASEAETALSKISNGYTNAFILGVDTSLLASISAPYTNVYQAVLDGVPYTAENFSEIEKAFKKAVKTEQLNQSNDADYIRSVIESEGEQLGIIVLNDVYEEILSERVKESDLLYTYLADAEFGNTSELRQAYMKSVVLTALASPKNGRFDVQYVLQTCKSDIGILSAIDEIEKLSSNNKSSVYSAISGKRFASVTELEKKLEELAESHGKKSPGNSSANSSGGSSGGKVSIANPTVNTPMESIFDSVPSHVQNGFSDLNEAQWAEDAILTLLNKKIVNGRGDGLFFPNSSITREEFLKMVVLTANLPEASGETKFSDVDPQAWYYSYVLQGLEAQVINGISEFSFGVGQNITRQDMAVMIYRVSKRMNINLTKRRTAYFTDQSEISDYASEAINALYGAGIINGNPDGSFAPQGTSTRAEAAMMLYGLISAEEAK